MIGYEANLLILTAHIVQSSQKFKRGSQSMNRVYNTLSHSDWYCGCPTPMLPSGPTHCHPHHCAYCVRYHKERLSTVWSKAGSVHVPTANVLRLTVQTSMNTHDAQNCHTTASHLIEHKHSVPPSTRTGIGGSPSPHMLSGSANDPALVTLLNVPGTITFTLVNTLRGAERSRQGDECA